MAKRIKSAVMWAIYNDDVGFYTGTHITRKDMIDQHTKDLGRKWGDCLADGDRAVQVVIKVRPTKRALDGAKSAKK